MSSRRGWVRVDVRTSVCLHQGQPVRLRSRWSTDARSLEYVASRASKWVGAPLKVGTWVRIDGQTWEAECGLAEPELGNKEWN